MGIDNVGDPGKTQGMPQTDPVQETKSTSEKGEPFVANQTDLKGAPKPGGTKPGDPVKPYLPPPKHDDDSLALMLMDLRNKIGDVQQKTSKEEIMDNMAKNKIANERKLEKLEEFKDKLEEASKAGLAKKIFGWIGSVFATIVAAIAAVALTVAAVAACATGVGAVVGIGLAVGAIGAIAGFTAAAGNLTMMVLDETGATEALINAIAGDNEDLKEDLMLAKSILTIAVTAVNVAITAICGVVSFIMTAGASGLSTLAQIASQIGTIVSAVGAIAGGALTAAKGGVGIYEAVLEKEAAFAKADSMEFQKMMKKLQAMMEHEMDRLREIIEQLEDGMSMVIQVFNKSDDTNMQIAKQMI